VWSRLGTRDKVDVWRDWISQMRTIIEKKRAEGGV
jgi:hypothetical protein